jgi:hypothetical protein
MSVEEWEKRAQERKDTAEAHRKILWIKLKEEGFKYIRIDYWGSGDSGEFDYPFVILGDIQYNEDEDFITSECKADEEKTKQLRNTNIVTKQIVSDWIKGEDGKMQFVPPGVREVTISLSEAISAAADSYLEHAHPGWEINEGSSGFILFDINKRTMRLEHEEYYTETTHHCSTWEE